MIFHTFEIKYKVVLNSNFHCMIFRTFGTRNCVSTGLLSDERFYLISLYAVINIENSKKNLISLI